MTPVCKRQNSVTYLQETKHGHLFARDKTRSPICKRQNSAWTLPSKNSQTMPPSGATVRNEVLWTAARSLSFTTPFPTVTWWWLPTEQRHGTAKILVVEADLGEGGSSFVEVYVPTTDFDAILDDPGDQLLLGDFNVPHPAWFSRTGDERTAARGEAVHGAINSLQLATLIRPLVSQPRASPPRQM